MSRFFIAFVIEAPWPDKLPPARLLEKDERHLTIAFLGEAPQEETLRSFSNLPPPSFSLGFCGCLDSLVFLPERTPRVVAYHVQMPHEEDVQAYVSAVHTHMKLTLRDHWIPHVTVGRRPFEIEEWQKAFHPLPYTSSKIALFESLGDLRYKTLAEIPLAPPIEKLDHTADIACILRGQSMQALFQNALIALALEDPRFLRFRMEKANVSSVDDIVNFLNRCIAKIDSEEGSPFKAVSFHGKLIKRADFLEWEMIVDV